MTLACANRVGFTPGRALIAAICEVPDTATTYSVTTGEQKSNLTWLLPPSQTAVASAKGPREAQHPLRGEREMNRMQIQSRNTAFAL